MHGGLSVRRAVWYNGLTGVAAIASAALTLRIGADTADTATTLLSVAAGDVSRHCGIRCAKRDPGCTIAGAFRVQRLGSRRLLSRRSSLPPASDERVPSWRRPSTFRSIAFAPNPLGDNLQSSKSGLTLPPQTIPYPPSPPQSLHRADPHSVVRGHVRHRVHCRRHARTLSHPSWLLVAVSSSQDPQPPGLRRDRTLIGARSVYIIVDGRLDLRHDPLEALRIWHGGLSFHGAILGMAVASAAFARRASYRGSACWTPSPCAERPVRFSARSYFISNAELYGRVTNGARAMIFPDPSHPPAPILLRSCTKLSVRACSSLALSGGSTDAAMRPAVLPRRGTLDGRLSHCIWRDAFSARIRCARAGCAAGVRSRPSSMGQLLCIAMVVVGVAVLVAIRPRGRPT